MTVFCIYSKPLIKQIANKRRRFLHHYLQNQCVNNCRPLQ